MTTPILMLGAGRMGGAMVQGWLAAGAFAPSDLMIRDPHPGEAARAAADAGAKLNPPDADLSAAPTVVLAVKPQTWREAASELAPLLAWDAVVVSIAAGVKLDDLAQAFGGRTVARAMPTTAAAIGQGAASIFARDPVARSRAHGIFAPLGTVVDIAEEDLMHAATAVSGSAPAYLYAFIEALEAAGVAEGLMPEAASRLARSTITGAAALLAHGREDPADLRRQVSSPGGVTLAALEVLMAETALPDLMRQAAAAAVRRSKELGG
jgi:pyrroline-5-carboxylate reductase